MLKVPPPLRNNLVSCVIVAVSILLASCAHESSDDFVGDWEFINSAGEHQGVAISANDGSSYRYAELVDGNEVGQLVVTPDRDGHITLNAAGATGELELADRNTMYLTVPNGDHKIKYQRVAHFSWENEAPETANAGSVDEENKNVAAPSETVESTADDVFHLGDRFTVRDASQVQCFFSAWSPSTYDADLRNGDKAGAALILQQDFLTPTQIGDVLKVLDFQSQSSARVIVERTQHQCYVSKKLSGLERL